MEERQGEWEIASGGGKSEMMEGENPDEVQTEGEENVIWSICSHGDQFCSFTFEEINKSLTLAEEQMPHLSDIGF